MNFKKNFSSQKDLLSIGFSNIVGSGISAIFWFYLATLINPEEYGQIHYFLGIAAMGQLFSLIATPNALTVYVAKNIKIHSTLFFISLLTGTLSAIIIFLIFFRFDASFLVLGYIIFELVNGFLLGKKLFSTYSKFFLTQKILTVIFGLGFFALFGFDGIIYGLVLSYIPYLWIFIKEFSSTKINFSLLKPRKGFIFNNYGINVSGAVGGQIDKIIIAPILGFELLGNYSLAMQFLVIMLLLPTIIFKYLLTKDSSGESTGNLKRISIVTSIGISAFGITILPILIPILFPQFVDTTIAIQILSIAIIPATIGTFYESKLLSLEKGKFPIISKSLGIISVIIGFLILGPIYGIVGLSITIVASSLIETIFIIIATKTLKLNTK
tara:strand:- start:1706 stop:2854 length:1149 start_codon:yes stop_codon:yes gene_type:complete